jgi:hypothetical protein
MRLLLTLALGLALAFFVFQSIGMEREFESVELELAKPELLVGILADTHIPTRARELPSSAIEALEGVDLIIHAGDIVSLSVIEELEKLAPVVAVHGNMDPAELRERFPAAAKIELLGWKIGVLHDSIVPWLGWKMRSMARKHGLDVLVFAHTHRPFLRQNDVLLINPGSPTNPFLASPSMALLKLNQTSFEARIVSLA